MGMHLKDTMTNPKGLLTFWKALLASKFLWITAVTLSRLSVIHLFTYIFDNKKFKYVACAVAACCVAFWLAFVLDGFLICQPLAYNWNKTISAGHCGSQYAEIIYPPTVNLLLDVFIITMPMPLLWKLNLPFKKKITITMVICLSFW